MSRYCKYHEYLLRSLRSNLIILFFLAFQDHDVLVTQSNEILTAIIHGMRSNEPSNHVRLAATNALHNSLEFTRANFDKEVMNHI